MNKLIYTYTKHQVQRFIFLLFVLMTCVGFLAYKVLDLQDKNVRLLVLVDSTMADNITLVNEKILRGWR